MFTGKRFRLKNSILGIESSDEQRIAIMVPTNAAIEVLSGPRPDDKRMVDVLWEDRKLVMFAEDITKRGEEVRSASSSSD